MRLVRPLIVVGVPAAIVGAFVRGLLPPFVLDEPFWREFWTGPPVAGLFAVIAAAVAFFPAFRSTHIARESAARDQWWKRAEWALGVASSDERTNREVANDALIALWDEATETEAKMIYRTIRNLQRLENMDTVGKSKENGGRRWLLWQR